MRCNNCGWENPSGNQKCEKCNAPLSGSMIGNNDEVQRKYHSVSEELKGTVPDCVSASYKNKKSYAEQSDDQADGKEANCLHCGYPVSPAMNVCPNCGNPLKLQPESPHDDTGGERREAWAENSAHRPNAPKPGKTCPKCGQKVLLSATFCPHCGTQLRMGTVPSWDTPQMGGFCTLKPLPWNGEEVVYQPISYSGTMISLNRGNTDSNNNTITSKEQAVLIHESDGWYIEDRSELHTTFVRADKPRKLESGDVVVLGNRLFEFKG